MEKSKIIKKILFCLAIFLFFAIAYFEILNKERMEVFENLTYKEHEFSIKKIDIDEAIRLQKESINSEQYSKGNKHEQDITILLENETVENIKFYEIVYRFGFQEFDDIDGEMVVVAAVLEDSTINKIEDIIIIGTNVYSKEYELLWVFGSESAEINQVKNSARIATVGYLEIKRSDEVYVSNTINIVHVFDISKDIMLGN